MGYELVITVQNSPERQAGGMARLVDRLCRQGQVLDFVIYGGAQPNVISPSQATVQAAADWPRDSAAMFAAILESAKVLSVRVRYPVLGTPVELRVRCAGAGYAGYPGAPCEVLIHEQQVRLLAKGPELVGLTWLRSKAVQDYNLPSGILPSGGIPGGRLTAGLFDLFWMIAGCGSEEQADRFRFGNVSVESCSPTSCLFVYHGQVSDFANDYLRSYATSALGISPARLQIGDTVDELAAIAQQPRDEFDGHGFDLWPLPELNAALVRELEALLAADWRERARSIDRYSDDYGWLDLGPRGIILFAAMPIVLTNAYRGMAGLPLVAREQSQFDIVNKRLR